MLLTVTTHKSNFKWGENPVVWIDLVLTAGNASLCYSIRFPGFPRWKLHWQILLFCRAEIMANFARSETKPILFFFMVHVKASSALFSSVHRSSSTSLSCPHEMTNDLICCRFSLSGHCRCEVNLNSIGHHVEQRKNTCWKSACFKRSTLETRKFLLEHRCTGTCSFTEIICIVLMPLNWLVFILQTSQNEFRAGIKPTLKNYHLVARQMRRRSKLCNFSTVQSLELEDQ